MLLNSEEVKQADLNAGAIINGVDNPNVLSIDSTTPIVTDADKVGEEKEKEEEKKAEEKAGGKTDEEKAKEEEKLKEAGKASAENTEKDKEKKEEKKEEKSEPQDTVTDPVEKRIGKLTKKWRTAERERDWERDQRLKAEAKVAKLEALIPSSAKPTREDFESDNEFLEALADWKVEEKLKSHAAVTESSKNEATAKQVMTEMEQKVDDISDRGADKYDDYKDVVFDKELVITQGMLEAVTDSDIAEDIFYYLGKNPDVSAAIGEMSAVRAAKEIGRIEAELIAFAKKTAEEAEKNKAAALAKKITKVPEPIVPPRETGITEKDPSQMSPKEYRAWRERKKE